MEDFVKNLKNRTFYFAVDVITFCEEIHSNSPKKFICDQLARSSGSVGSNYRAACRPKSNKDFLNKLNIVLEEADESLFWLELLEFVSPNADKKKLNLLKKEANELISIFVKSIATTKNSIKNSKVLKSTNIKNSK
jgi:four helix bundle protein